MLFRSAWVGLFLAGDVQGRRGIFEVGEPGRAADAEDRDGCDPCTVRLAVVRRYVLALPGVAFEWYMSNHRFWNATVEYTFPL